MAALVLLLALGFLVLPVASLIWMVKTSGRLDKLSNDITHMLGRLSANARIDAPQKEVTPAAAAPAANTASETALQSAAETVDDFVPLAPPAPVSPPRFDPWQKKPAAPTPQTAQPAAHHAPVQKITAPDNAQAEEFFEVEIDTAPRGNNAPSSSTSFSSGAPADFTGLQTPDLGFRIGRWLTENWMLVTGATFVLLSISWLVRYALLEDIITAPMRIGAGFALGGLIAALGLWRARKFAQQGAIFMVLGCIAMILTMYAAREIYGYFTPVIALGFSFVTAAFLAYRALRMDMPVLSYAALILAMLAPAMTAAPESNFTNLFSYLAVVLSATLLLVLKTGWRKNIFCALVIVLFYSVPFIKSAAPPPADIKLMTVFGFALAFFVADMVGHFRAVRNGFIDILMPLVLAVFLTVWIVQVSAADVRPLFLMSWAAIFLLGSGILVRRTGARSVFYTYLTVAVALIVATTVVEMRGVTLVVMLTLESAALTLLCWYVMRSRAATQASVYTMLIPLLAAAGGIDPTGWNNAGFNEQVLMLVVMAAVLLGLASHFHRLQARNPDVDMPVKIGEITFWLGAGSLCAYGAIWIFLHSAMSSAPFAIAVAMIIYALVGIAAYVCGHRRDSVYMSRYGAYLLALVLGRLLLVDLPSMPVAARVVMFFGIGVLFLATAFIRYQKKENSTGDA